MDTAIKPYSVCDLNWVVAVDGRKASTDALDAFSAPSPAAHAALSLLGGLFSQAAGRQILLATTTRLITARDYALTGFNRQLGEALDFHLGRMCREGTLNDAFAASSSFLFGDDLFDDYFDVALPSLLTLEQRPRQRVETYILPVKVVTEDVTGAAGLAIAALFNSEANIQNIVAAFKSTELVRGMQAASGSDVAVIPLVGEMAVSGLRGIVAGVRRIQGGGNDKKT